MLAIVGTLVQTFYHLPDPVFSNPKPLAALAQIYSERPVAFWQLFLTIGAIELTVGKQDTLNKVRIKKTFQYNRLAGDTYE